MTNIGSLQLVPGFHVRNSQPTKSQFAAYRRTKSPSLGHLGSTPDFIVARLLVQDAWCGRIWHQVGRDVVPIRAVTVPEQAAASVVKEQSKYIVRTFVKVTAIAFSRTLAAVQGYPLLLQCGRAVGLMAFSLWGLGPTMRLVHKIFLKKDKWDSSQTHNIMTSYMRPLLLWLGVILICRAFDPVVLSSEAAQAIKQRFLNFVQSLSTVLAFAFCTASLTQQVQAFMMKNQDAENSRNVGVQFIGNTVYTSVWVAAVCLFMELLGFSTQKWITAGGFGTVLLTLAGREIFTNFLSSIMIHATRPFVESEWIQTKIEGQEVSGTVEHVGWWSPTVIRGDDREAVHIPNHKFTVSVVRNLSQKTHWRIKTHFGISHLDVSKMPDIIADMRKVLSKNPSVEQHRLHRRAFFDTIDPDNQALLVLVSCFVKTPHFEEYLRVKEVILLDLLRVISHHNARLATPIRSVQRILDENEGRSAAYRDVRGTEEAKSRPYLLLEAAAVMAAETMDKDRSKIKAEVKDQGTEVGVEQLASSGEKLSSANGAASEDSDLKGKLKTKDKSQVVAESSSKIPSVEYGPAVQSVKPQLEGLDSMGLNSKDITLLKAAFEKPPANIPDGPVDSGPYGDIPQSQSEKGTTKSSSDQPKTSKINVDPQSDRMPTKVTAETSKSPKSVGDSLEKGACKACAEPQRTVVENVKSDPENVEEPQDSKPWRQQAQASLPTTPVRTESASWGGEDRLQAMPRPQSVEDNLVLGVALDGPKRTLPIDQETLSPSEQRELVSSRNGNNNAVVKERREPSSPQTSSSSGSPVDARDGER